MFSGMLFAAVRSENIVLQTCTSLEPFNEQCQFMKGASLATVGEYFPAVKEFTKVTMMLVVSLEPSSTIFPMQVMLNRPANPMKPSSEHKRVIYLRGVLK